MANFADRVIQFNKELEFSTPLYNGIQTMNPFKENVEIISIIESFYGKFYGDNKRRKMILGINPGRLGAGVTGIPFTDTKRLTENCGIEIESVKSHEPSSVFIYELIGSYGGTTKFYQDFYINSVCPLGFIEKNKKGNWVNRNYYDYKELFLETKNFIVSSLKKQIEFGIDTSSCYVLGKKNAKFLKIINDEQHLFDEIIVFEHPRYIIQYKMKEKDKYVSEYLAKLKKD